MSVAPGYDFGSPFAVCTIVTEDGERVPLWFAPPGQRPRGRAHSFPFVTSVVVKIGLSNIPIVTVQLTPPYGDAIAFLDSALIEWGTAKLEVQLGYATGLQGPVVTPVYSGILLKPDVTYGADATITLNAQGLSTFNITSQSSGRLLRGTRQAIVERLLRGPDPLNPRELYLDDTEMARAPAEVRAGWAGRTIEIQQAGVSDWQWVLTLVWECRAAFYVLGNTIKVFPRDTRATESPTRRFVFYNIPNGQLGPSAAAGPTYPILGVSSPSSGIYLPGYLRGSVLQGASSETRGGDRRVVDDSTVRMGRTGSGGVNERPSPANPGRGPQAEGLEVFPGQPADARVREQVNAAQLDFAQRAGIKLEVDSLGVPDILPGETVSVAGLGVRIDGPNYMVFDVAHTIDGSGFGTHLTKYANVSETWTRALPAAGPVPQREPAATLAPGQERIEVRSRDEEQRLAEASGLTGEGPL